MRAEPNLRADKHRINPPGWESDSGANWGAFQIGPLRIISSGTDDEHGWEHVSVSKQHGTPTWNEMCLVKDLFWREDEVVMQLHPAKADYVNQHPNCLHLWRPLNVDIPRPPTLLVGMR